MACCYSYDCGEYAVSPRLTGACYPECEESPECVPCLPRCPKGPKGPKGIIYVCEKKPKKVFLTPFDPEYKERHKQKKPSCPTCDTQGYSAAKFCPTCQQPSYKPSPPICKPCKTKYIMPCYRYEDGRINQPTALMRRACEVAVGNRKKPFMCSTSTEQSGEVCKFHCEDEKDNRCYHCELKKCGHQTPGSKAHPHMPPVLPCDPCDPCYQCLKCQLKPQPRRASSPECRFVECVPAKAVDPPETCYFYC